MLGAELVEPGAGELAGEHLGLAVEGQRTGLLPLTADNKILNFGEGIHSCMGAPIARLLAQVAVEELVAGLDGTEVRVVGTPEHWAKQMVRGFAALPIKIVPTEPVVVVRTAQASTAHLEKVQHRSTRLTLATRELETEPA